jgi:hypothetical protein
MTIVIMIVFVAAAVWFFKKSYTADGVFDMKQGLAALLALGAAVWAYISDLGSSLLQ